METTTQALVTGTVRFCPKCGVTHADEATTCREDGTDLLPVGTGEDLTGQTIKGKYLVLKCLGHGAFGAVYLALHKLAKAEVAIKVLLEDRQSDGSARRQFLKEAQAVMRLHSRSAVLVNDIDEDEQGRLFIVMELLKGRNLADFISKVAPGTRRLPVAQVVGFATRICDALEDAHSKGVVHRDLKPANVMVVEGRNGELEAKVVDFGIARLHSLTDTGNSTTETMLKMAGTPAYMSPEQCRGLDVDGRSDLYGLGVMLYELLSGKRPFRSETATAMIIAHATETPMPLSMAYPDLDVPPALDRLVSSLLEKDPAKRPQSAAEVLAVLGDIERGGGGTAGERRPTVALAEPVPSAAPSSGRPGRAWIAALAAALAVAIASGVTWYLLQSDGEPAATAAQPAPAGEAAAVATPPAPATPPTTAPVPAPVVPAPAAAAPAPAPAAPAASAPPAAAAAPAAAPAAAIAPPAAAARATPGAATGSAPAPASAAPAEAHATSAPAASAAKPAPAAPPKANPAQAAAVAPAAAPAAPAAKPAEPVHPKIAPVTLPAAMPSPARAVDRLRKAGDSAFDELDRMADEF